jgi:CBS domain-containing protein
MPGDAGRETPAAFRRRGGREFPVHGEQGETMTNERVREVMTPAPATIGPQDTAVEAARLMASQDVGSLPVVENGNLVGIVTDRDLVLHVLAKDVDPHQTTVASVCSENPVVVTPEDSLDEALQRMAREQIRRLPVVEDERLVGILAQADVSRAAEPAETGRMVEQISVSDA